MTLTLLCPYCGMAWDVSSSLEAGRIIGQHEDLCDYIPSPFPDGVGAA